MAGGARFDRFGVGLSAATRGLGAALRTPEVRSSWLGLMAVTLATTIALDVAGIWSLWHFTDPSSGWWAVAIWLLRIVGMLLVLWFAPVFAVAIAFPLLGPRVFFAALRAKAPARAAELAAAPGLSFATGVGIALRRLLRVTATFVVVFAISWIPIAGAPLALVLGFAATAHGLAWELLDPWLDKLGLRWADQRKFVARERSTLLGFGLPLAAAASVPIVGSVVIAMSQAAVATLVVDVLEAPPRS
jgi:uncharacterized protein involved in cysteine biosynthesis